jgi:hypothetical protein
MPHKAMYVVNVVKLQVEVAEKMFGSWVTPLVGRHVVDELGIFQTVRRHVVD